MKPNLKFWKNKKILITGHTGFKGGWLTVLLHVLKSKVSGYALNPQGVHNFFNAVNLKKILENDFRKNITDLNNLKKSIKKIKPEIIFHLAAQSSVIKSFKDSKNTILSNVVGTSNLLEACKNQKYIKSVIIITTDKVYQNYKVRMHFNENSLLGGDDVYSGSKACCEILTNSYKKSFFQNTNCNIATVRAGNCFGGGDWTEDRIVKDSLETCYDNKDLILRNPNATRPWQHVVEPLTGYLKLAEKLCSRKGKKFAEPWNFAPSTKQNMKVIDLAKLIKLSMDSKSKIIIKKNDKRFQNKKFKIFESKFLNINSLKALKKLNWKSKLPIHKSVKLTTEWYHGFKNKQKLLNLTINQIKSYIKI